MVGFVRSPWVTPLLLHGETWQDRITWTDAALYIVVQYSDEHTACQGLCATNF